MTSLGVGVAESDCDFSARNRGFCSLESSASNSEIALARRISGLRDAAIARALDMSAASDLQECEFRLEREPYGHNVLQT